MAEYAYRAARKPARGGVDNLHYVIAAVEQLPPELTGIAARAVVNFPWGSLLRGLLRPDEGILRAIAATGSAGAGFELVLSYDPAHDTGALAGGETLPAPDEAYIDGVLAPAYAAAGIWFAARRRLDREVALAIPSTWGRRLLHARPRDVYLIEGSIA